jgi:cell division transport system permease protein
MRLGLILSEVGQGFRRNLSMVVSVVLVTFISLTFFGAAILLQFQIGEMKGYWYDRAQVVVYFCTDISLDPKCAETAATEEQVAAVQEQLEGPTLAPFIKEKSFQTQQEAYEEFVTEFADSPLAALMTPETFSQAIWINMKDPERADIIVDSFATTNGVEEVKDQRAFLDPIFSVMNTASVAAVGVAALMLIAAVLLIATTIRLSAFSRRREIGIMRLVGASNRFIETPFILEGVIAAFIGSLLAGVAIVAIVQFFVQGYLIDTISSAGRIIDAGDALLVVPILLAVGAVLAALSAGVAIRRYLKV